MYNCKLKLMHSISLYDKFMLSPCQWKLLADRLGILDHRSQINFSTFLISFNFQVLINFSYLSVPVASILYLSINPSY